MTIPVNHHAALREGATYDGVGGTRIHGTKLGKLVIAAFQHITGLPDSRRSLVTCRADSGK
jgi:hypothetical protein